MVLVRFKPEVEQPAINEAFAKLAELPSAIAGIERKRRGDVRRAKLYYLRERSGKAARIKEKI